MQTSESKIIGAEYVIAEQMKRYGFDQFLSELDFSSKQIDYAKELSRWINDDSAIKELIGSTEAVYDNALHRTAAMLQQHGEQIEKSLRHKAKELFSLDDRIVLYDRLAPTLRGKRQATRRLNLGDPKNAAVIAS